MTEVRVYRLDAFEDFIVRMRLKVYRLKAFEGLSFGGLSFEGLTFEDFDRGQVVLRVGRLAMASRLATSGLALEIVGCHVQADRAVTKLRKKIHSFKT